MTKVPPGVMSGKSPMKISCSLISSVSLLRSRTRTFSGFGVGGVPGLAFLDGVLGLLVHGVVHEAQLEVAGIVGDGVHILEHLAQAFL
jgi:hypothetical protein